MGSLDRGFLQMAAGAETSLEIFLFSNGQQDSPPRKYNVPIDNRLGSTLKFFARSQSGSNHTLELYTTEGKKVEHAQELTNGAAYVAVEPPQPFVPAGYNDYLMKASRSRDKRQEKLSENTPNIKPDNIDTKYQTEEENKDTTKIKILQDITITPTSRATIEGQGARSNVKTEINRAVKPITPIRRMNTKPPRKNTSLPPSNLYTSKRNISNSTPVKKRNTIPKIETNTKKVEISSARSMKTSNLSIKSTEPIVTITTESKSKNDETSAIKVKSNNQFFSKAFDLSKSTDTTDSPGRYISGYISTQNLTADAVVIEKNLLLPISEKILPKSESTIPNRQVSKMDLFYHSNDAVPLSNQEANFVDVKNQSSALNISHMKDGIQTDFIKKVNESEITATTVKTNSPNESSQKNTLLIGSQTADNNFAIYVKQGSVINLKLNIEVKSLSNSTLEVKHFQPDRLTRTVANSPGPDDEDLSRNMAGSKQFCEVPTLTEPWVAGLPCEQLQQVMNDVKGAICRCSCCSSSKTEDVAPVYVDNNNYFILLPQEEINQHAVSCACPLNDNEENKQDIDDEEVSSDKKDIVKFHEEYNLESSKITVTQNHVSIEREPNDEIIIEKQVDECNRCENCSIPYPVSLCNCGQKTTLECPVCEKEPAYCRGLVVNRSIKLIETFTQTDWSGIVLEARPQADGSYAFYIPSLELLKNTNNL